MPKLVPSQVIAQIDKVFPGANDRQFVLRAEHSAKVGTILQLFDRIPAQHFSLLSLDDQLLLVTAQARIRAAMEQWRTVGPREKAVSGGPGMGREPELGDRNPIATLREILAKCPDDAPSEAVSKGPEPPSQPPDTVTGLPDKGAFKADFPRAVSTAQRDGNPLALLMIDVDNFKEVNDSHGHSKGDEVLRGVAQRLQVAVMGKGAAYRWGGDEMAILLPNHSLDEALAVAERARRSLEHSPVAEVLATVSVGVAVFPDHAQDGPALFAAADTAMYDAKKKCGRNLVRYYGEPDAPAKTAPAPRASARKQPQPDQLPDDWAETARVAHFRGESVRCPRDSARLRVEETSGMGEVGGLFFFCPACGLTVQADGRPLT